MIKPKKALGQNFLIDKNILLKIFDSIEVNPNDFILEIGPGTGALTEYILNRKPKKFVAVDIDERSIEFLKEKFPLAEYPFFDILQSDIRKIELTKYFNSEIYNRNIVVGNIPYNISADIFFWIFSYRDLITKSILMVQKEVAQRLNAKPKTKNYGLLSLVINLIGTAKILFDVSPNCFYPRPKVTSSVIELKFDKKLTNQEFEDLLSLFKAAFSQRRKVLKNSLSTYLSNTKIETGFLKSDVFLKYCSKRAEELEVENYIELMNEIKRFR